MDQKAHVGALTTQNDGSQDAKTDAVGENEKPSRPNPGSRPKGAKDKTPKKQKR